MQGKVEEWMKENKDSYLKECEDANDALEYLIMDCPIRLNDSELRTIAKKILGIEGLR